MAVSNSSNFTATRTQIIRAAALKVGAIGTGVAMSSQMEQDMAHELNAMVKMWHGMGIHVWTTIEATLFQQLDQIKYQLGSSDHATESYVQTTISAAEASGQTTISLTSSTGMTAADNIGIIVDDGTVHWMTFSSIPGSTRGGIAPGIDAAAAAGNYVFAYTTKIVRPLKVVDVRRHNLSSGNETSLGEPISRKEYQALSNKTSEGTINQVWYDPGRDTGYLYLWNEPSAIDDLIKFTWHRPIMDFDAAGDNPDLPQEWILPLVFNLAKICIATFPVSTTRANRIIGLADQYLDAVMGFDREEGSVFLQPDMDAYA